MKKKIDKELPDIKGKLNFENKDKGSKKESISGEKRRVIKNKKTLIVIEDGKIYTFRDNEIDLYIDSLPEDYNVNYVLENDDSVVINKDYKKIAPMVKYLLGNIYESLELKAIHTSRTISVIFNIVIIFLILIIYILTPNFKKDTSEIKENMKNIPKEKIVNNTGSGVINSPKDSFIDLLDTNKGGGSF